MKNIRVQKKENQQDKKKQHRAQREKKNQEKKPLFFRDLNTKEQKTALLIFEEFLHFDLRREPTVSEELVLSAVIDSAIKAGRSLEWKYARKQELQRHRAYETGILNNKKFVVDGLTALGLLKNSGEAATKGGDQLIDEIVEEYHANKRPVKTTKRVRKDSSD